MLTATGTSAMVQFRLLGGALALCLVTAIMNNNLRQDLLPHIGPEVLSRIFRTTAAINALSEPTKALVRSGFMRGYNLQLRILIGFAGAQLPATLLMWQKDGIKIE